MKAMTPGMDLKGLDSHGKSGTKKSAVQNLGQDAVPLTFANLLQAIPLPGQPKGVSGKHPDHSGGQARIASYAGPHAANLVQTGPAKTGAPGHPNAPAPILHGGPVKPGKPEMQGMTATPQIVEAQGLQQLRPAQHQSNPHAAAVRTGGSAKSTSVHPSVPLRIHGEPRLPARLETAPRLADEPVLPAGKAATGKLRVGDVPVTDSLPQGTVQRAVQSRKLVALPGAVTQVQSEGTANLPGTAKADQANPQQMALKPEQTALRQVAGVSVMPVKKTELPASAVTGITFATHHLTALSAIQPAPTTGAQQSTANAPAHTLSTSHPNPAQALSDIVLGQVQAGKDQVKVQIHPQGMGSIVVAVTKHVDGGIQLQVVANQMVTMQWLAAQSNQIADAVRSSGVAVSGVQVSFGRTDLGSSNNTGGQSSRRHRHGQAAPHGVAAVDGLPAGSWSRTQDYLEWRKGAISIQV